MKLNFHTLRLRLPFFSFLSFSSFSFSFFFSSFFFPPCCLDLVCIIEGFLPSNSLSFQRLSMGELRLGYMITWVQELTMMLQVNLAQQWPIVRTGQGSSETNQRVYFFHIFKMIG
jgi:hypothetical protein